MRCMLSYKEKEFVQNFIGQLINVKLELILLHTLLLKQISVQGWLDWIGIGEFSHLDVVLPVDLACCPG